MGFSNEAKPWAQKIQDAAKAALEKARGKRSQEAPPEVPTVAPAEAPEVAEVRAETEVSTEVPGEIPAEEVLEAAAAEADADAEVSIEAADVHAEAAAPPDAPVEVPGKVSPEIAAQEVPEAAAVDAEAGAVATAEVPAEAAAEAVEEATTEVSAEVPVAETVEVPVNGDAEAARKGDAVSQVTEHLQRRGVPFEVIPHGQAFTSLDEAQALGIAAGEVVKTVMVHAVSGPVLVAVPGYRRLDMPLVRTAVGDHHARLATEEELAREFSDYELGALPPLGSLLRAHVYVDPEVMDHDTVVFAAGSQTESVKIRTEDLFRDEPVTVAPLSRHLEEDDKELIE
jgi:Ala-tRNA(Pro) deacylase